MIQDGVAKSFWFNDFIYKSLWAPPHNAKYTPPSEKNKNISTMDSFIACHPNLSRGDAIDYKKFSNETPGFPVPVHLQEASSVTSTIELTVQVSDKMFLRGVSGLIVRAKDLGVCYTASADGVLLKKQVITNITKHFKELHKAENTN
jgi:hypothetical protein